MSLLVKKLVKTIIIIYNILKGGLLKMAKGNKDYFGLSYLVSVILAIIPVTSWVLGILTRFKDGNLIAAIIRIFLGWNIIYILDLIFMILNKKIFRLL